MNTYRQRPDWIVERVTMSDDRHYPLHLQGINLNYGADHPNRRFCWSVPLNGIEWCRYGFDHRLWRAIWAFE